MLTLFDVQGKSELLASVDVSANTEAERAAILANLKDLYGDAVYYLHLCGHDTGLPCSQERV